MPADSIILLLLITSAAMLAAFLIIGARSIVYMIPMLNGPVFVPSRAEDIETMIKLAGLKKGDKVADLGSGDGEIVIALAKLGYQVDGFEINPLLVRRSRKRVKALGLEDKATIYKKSFWEPNLGEYDAVMLYGTTYIMKKLEKKVQNEFKKGSRLISNYFTFPNWKPVKSTGHIHKYEK